jgi:hypothetical protein
MQLIKHTSMSKNVIPLLSALPYSVILDKGEDVTEEFAYDPTSQRTVYQAGRDYSTSRSDDSAGGIFSSKSDTKKDD